MEGRREEGIFIGPGDRNDMTSSVETKIQMSLFEGTIIADFSLVNEFPQKTLQFGAAGTHGRAVALVLCHLRIAIDMN